MNVEAVELTAADGVILRGQLWVGGDNWLILFHDKGSDLDCWQFMAPALMERGYSLLALDMRGHGASEGEWSVPALGDDLDTAVAYAQGQGARKIAFVGAGASGVPVLSDAPSRPFFAAVLLSPSPLDSLSPDEIRGRGVAKLIMFGSQGDQAVADAQQIHNLAIGWIVLLRLPTTDQGTALLSDRWRLHILENTIKFIDEQLFLSDNAGTTRQDWSPSASNELLRRLLGGG